MKFQVFIITFFIAGRLGAQQTGDTTYSRCPVAITDTSGYNNYFISHQPAIIKLERIKGNIVITIQQKDQFYTMFFRSKKLSDKNYKIVVGAGGKNELDAKYSFRSGGRASYVNTTSGIVEVMYDKEKLLWHLKVNALLSNLVDRSVAYYKVKADFYLK
jgi:hypothetical protein